MGERKGRRRALKMRFYLFGGSGTRDVRLPFSVGRPCGTFRGISMLDRAIMQGFISLIPKVQTTRLFSTILK